VRYAFVVGTIIGVLASWFVVAYGTGRGRTDIEVSDLWLGETAGPRAVFHGTVANRGMNGDRLLRLSFAIAKRVAIFDHLGREIESLRMPADSELVLGGNAPRFEAVGLTRPINAHEILPLLLVFERAGKLRVNARVEAMLGTSEK